MTESEKFVVLGLQPGVRKGNFLGLLLGVFCMALCFVSSNTVQVWVLDQHLQLDKSLWGNATGTLGSVGQMVTIALAGAFGALADQRGARKVLVAGVAIMAVGLWITPHVTTFTELLVARSIFSVGRSAMSACFTILIAEYVLRTDLGKAGAFQGTMFGLGAMTSVPILKLPRWLLTLGFEPVRAGVVTYSIVASVATVMAIGLWLSLRKTTGNGAAAERYSFFGLVRAGLKAARAPAVALSYGASFASAANMSVVGAFLTVWTVRYGETVGLSSAEGLALGGSLFMVMQIGSMLFMPIYGPMMDKLGPLRGLILGLSLATLGYSLTIFMDHPGDGYSYAVCALLGVSQAAMILSAQVFVQSEAPPEVRGTVIGFFAVSAGAGGVVALQLGGYLFDAWHYSGPFVLGGVIDLAVLAWAVSLLSTMARPTQPDKG